MIRIVKPEIYIFHRIYCLSCNTLFEYTLDSVERNTELPFIICPKCGRRIYV